MNAAIPIRPITNQKDAVIYFITKLDVEMLNDILDENLKYQDFEKHKFLSKLQDVFVNFIELGETVLDIYEGKCNECNKCDTGISFIGNNSKNYIDLTIKSDQGKVTDIFECCNFSNEKNVEKSHPLYIDYRPF